jgi:hypothetical protein
MEPIGRKLWFVARLVISGAAYQSIAFAPWRHHPFYAAIIAVSAVAWIWFTRNTTVAQPSDSATRRRSAKVITGASLIAIVIVAMVAAADPATFIDRHTMLNFAAGIGIFCLLAGFGITSWWQTEREAKLQRLPGFSVIVPKTDVQNKL